MTYYCNNVGTTKEHENDFKRLGIQISYSEEKQCIAIDLPEGWTVGEPSESGEVRFYDTFGRPRASLNEKIFGKENCKLLCRYNLSYDVEAENKVNPTESFMRAVVRDCDGLRVYQTGIYKASSWEDHGIAMSMLKEWMRERYPFWEDPNYYWTF